MNYNLTNTFLISQNKRLVSCGRGRTPPRRRSIRGGHNHTTLLIMWSVLLYLHDTRVTHVAGRHFLLYKRAHIPRSACETV